MSRNIAYDPNDKSFKKLKLIKRNHGRELVGGDYLITKESDVIIACPICGDKFLIIDRRNKVTSTEPLTIERAISLPCKFGHWFTVTKGIMESSIYCWGETMPEVYSQKRCKLDGFDTCEGKK